jgi:5-formyltetrahydrofolate cyclo-ligase
MYKAVLRKTYQEKRRALSRQELENLSQKICRRFFEEISLQAVRHLHIFLPIARQNELDTWPIIQQLQQQYPQIGIVVSRTNWQERKMEHYHLDDSTILEENKWGIPEPVGGPACPVAHIDLVLLPLLAFDRQGNRLGYGAGFYDRFLAECAPDTYKVGLSLFPPLPEPISDVNPHDIPLDACLTPEGSYWF